MNSVHASIIAITEDPLDAWLLKIPGNIAVSDAGIAFLSAQITKLEHRCAALRARSAIHACKQFQVEQGTSQNAKGGIWKQPLHKIARYISRILEPQKIA